MTEKDELKEEIEELDLDTGDIVLFNVSTVKLTVMSLTSAITAAAPKVK